MREELDILEIVAENPSISQRKISEQTGISLGQVNFLIKKYVKKGLIKIEGQTSKSIKYNLTPKGLSEKAALTMQYIKISYAAVIALTEKIRAVVEHAINVEVQRLQCRAGNGMGQKDNSAPSKENDESNIRSKGQSEKQDLQSCKIYVCGDHDEILEIVKLALNDKRVSLEMLEYMTLENYNAKLLKSNNVIRAGSYDITTNHIGSGQTAIDIEAHPYLCKDNNEDKIVLYWDELYRELLESIHCIKAINILH